MSMNMQQPYADSDPEKAAAPSRNDESCTARLREGVYVEPPITDECAASNESDAVNDSSKDQKFSNISWDDPNNIDNPMNWQKSRKWMATATVAMFALISPFASSMVAPALSSIGQDLNVPAGFRRSLILSMFLLAYTVGPLLLAPLSEVFGRARIFQAAFLCFFVFDLACGFARTEAQMLVFRFFSGIGSSAALTAGTGVLADLWPAEERGRAMGYYTAGPLLGPAIGPIVGGFISEHTTWRWIFWAVAIYTGVVQCIGAFFLRETYGPVLRARKAKRATDGSTNSFFDISRNAFGFNSISLHELLRKALIRPFYLLFTQPIVQAIAIFQIYLYGMMYFIITIFPDVWSGVYGMSTEIGSLNYIAIGLGFVCASICASPLNDKIYVYLKQRYGSKGKPEFRVPLMFPASFLVFSGLIIYGWTARYKAFWIGPDIGIFLWAFGTMIGFQSIQTYCVDVYTQYAASAMSVIISARSAAGFGFPLFAPAMYHTLGLGWGDTLLAFIGLFFGLMAAVLFWLYGEALRRRSSMAQKE